MDKQTCRQAGTYIRTCPSVIMPTTTGATKAVMLPRVLSMPRSVPGEESESETMESTRWKRVNRKKERKKPPPLSILSVSHFQNKICLSGCSMNVSPALQGSLRPVTSYSISFSSSSITAKLPSLVKILPFYVTTETSKALDIWYKSLVFKLSSYGFYPLSELSSQVSLLVDMFLVQ